jgi:hypothetical protein
MTRRKAHVASAALGVAVVALAATSLAAAGGRHDRKGSKDDHGVAARMSGYQETPSLNTTGRGTFRATLSDDKITFRLDYSDLTGPPAVAHVHVGQFGVAGAVSFFLCGGGGKPACPASTSGTVSGTVVASDVVGPTAQGFNPGDLASVLKAIDAGVTYANMHTAKFPSGEIRGQILGRPGSHDKHD